MIARRLARARREPLPDLLLIDGGKGQLAVVSAALADAGVAAGPRPRSRRSATSESPSPRVKRSGGLKAERVFLPNRKDPIALPPELARAAAAPARARRVAPLRDRVPARAALEAELHLDPRGAARDRPGQAARAARAQLGSLRAVREAPIEALATVPRPLGARRADDRGFFDGFVEPPRAETGEAATGAEPPPDPPSEADPAADPVPSAD